MYTSLIMLQATELNTILPQIDDLAKNSNLNRADIIRNTLYQYFEYTASERPSTQKEQERNKEISLQLTLHDKYILVFLDVYFQSKYLGTSSFRRMITAINILNKSFIYGSPFNTLAGKQSKYPFDPQTCNNYEEVLNDAFNRSWSNICKQDLKLLSNFYFFYKTKRRNGTMTRRNGIIGSKRETIIRIGLKDMINRQNAMISISMWAESQDWNKT